MLEARHLLVLYTSRGHRHIPNKRATRGGHTWGMYKPVFCTGTASTASTKSPGSCFSVLSWLLCLQVSSGMLSRYCSAEVTACLPEARLASSLRSGGGNAGNRLLASSRKRLKESPAASLCQKSSHSVSASAKRVLRQCNGLHCILLKQHNFPVGTVSYSLTMAGLIAVSTTWVHSWKPEHVARK